MSDTQKSQAEKNADSIEQEEQTQHTPRGNVHSEEEGQAPEQEAPPPLAH